MRFSAVKAAKGRRAEKVVTFPGDVKSPSGEPVLFAFRPILGEEEASAVAKAIAFAASKGAPGAKRGEELFDVGYMAAILALSAVDVESPESARTPFFADQAEVLGLERETIAYLHEIQDEHQMECSPYEHHLKFEDLLAVCEKEASSSDDAFFLALSPSTRRHSFHIMASLLCRLPAARSLLSSVAALPIGAASESRLMATIEEHIKSSSSSSNSSSESSAESAEPEAKAES